MSGPSKKLSTLEREMSEHEELEEPTVNMGEKI